MSETESDSESQRLCVVLFFHSLPNRAISCAFGIFIVLNTDRWSTKKCICVVFSRQNKKLSYEKKGDGFIDKKAQATFSANIVIYEWPYLMK